MITLSKALILFTVWFASGAAQDIEYGWEAVRGSCSAICGPTGVRPSLVYCKNLMTHAVEPLFHCVDKERPTVNPSEPCNRIPCDGKWVGGDFSNCTSFCNGVRTREYDCYQLQGDGRGTIQVAEDQCSQPKPNEQKICGRECIAPKLRLFKCNVVFPVSPMDITCPVGNDVFVHEGNRLIIDVEIEEGTPNPNLTWILPNGVFIPIGGSVGKFQVLANGSLQVPDIRKEDEGTYTVTLTNAFGTDSETTPSVFVVSPPSFEYPLTSGTDSVTPVIDIGSDVAVHAGSYVLIQARLAKSHLNTTINWTLPNGDKLAVGESSGNYQVFINGTLAIKNVQTSLAGVYTASATSLGGISRATTQISVVNYEWSQVTGECSVTCGSSGLRRTSSFCVEKSRKTRAPDSRCVVAGLGNKPASSAQPCNRQPCKIHRVFWDTDDWQSDPCRPCRDLQERQIYCKQVEDTNITITDDEMVCVGFPKPLGSQICSQQQCEVPPKFRVPPLPPMPLNMSTVYNRYDLKQSAIGVKGRFLFIDAVLAKGTPPVKIFWTLPNGNSIIAGRSVGRFTVFDNGTLRIDDVTTDDRGEYRIVAMNEFGKDTFDSIVNVYVFPNITSLRVFRNYSPLPVNKPSAMVRPGDTTAIQCQFDGMPVPTYKWLRDGVLVTYGKRVKVDSAGCLIIEKSQTADSGVYECVVENVLGVVKQSVALEVREHDTFWDTACDPCSKTCNGGSRLCKIVCRNKTSGQEVANSECSSLRKLKAFREYCNDVPCSAPFKPTVCPSCTFSWKALSYNNTCTSDCRRYRQVQCLNQNGEPSDKSNCSPRRKPAEFKRCRSKEMKPIWRPLQWSKCSKTCGTGRQSRNVKCVNPCSLKKRKGCNMSNKPSRKQPCNTFKC
eukprot:m.242631 g.242631  ORF g.242631 m.242631 type:complete len:890 (+) comp40221_c2_seq3:3111-5780(+)